jgi:hypothetical protein
MSGAASPHGVLGGVIPEWQTHQSIVRPKRVDLYQNLTAV